MKKKYGRLFDVAAHRIATRMVERLVRHSTRAMKSTAKDTAGFSIPLSAFESEGMREVFKASAEQAAGLIKRIPEQYLDQVQNAVMRSIQTGSGTQTLFDELERYGVGIKNWAYNTSRDQTTKVYGAVAKQNMLDAGVKKFQWMHSGGGSHPREYHMRNAPEGLNRGIFRFDDPPVIDEKTGEKGFPTQLPNCFPGDSVVDLSNGCMKLFRRRYSGELITLVTDDGKVSRSTPNHPILTDRGWLPVKLVNEGDYVVERAKQGIDIGKDQINHVNARFDDVFDFLLAAVNGGFTRVGSSGFEFHGDIGTEKEIDVIDLDGFLPDWIEPHLAEEIVEFILSRPDASAMTFDLSADGPVYAFIEGITSSPEGVVRSLSALFTEIWREPSRAREAGLRWGSYFNAIPSKHPADQWPAARKFFGNFQFAHAADVVGNDLFFGHLLSVISLWGRDRKRDIPSAERLGEIVGIAAKGSGNILEGSSPVQQFSRVAQKIVGEFSGHVHNVETLKGWYMCNDIIYHNCRCFARPIFDYSED
jgi:hypothetical protein